MNAKKTKWARKAARTQILLAAQNKDDAKEIIERLVVAFMLNGLTPRQSRRAMKQAYSEVTP